MIVVVNPGKVRQLEMAGERCSFAANSFHQITVPTKCINAIVEDLESRAVVVGGQPGRGHCHSHAIGDPLAERASGGLDACRNAVRSEEHTSELQSPYVISYAVF